MHNEGHRSTAWNDSTYLYSSQHGSFGGPGLAIEEYFSAGSDDFRGYVWKLPDAAEMIERRQKVSADEWAAGDSLPDVGKLFWRLGLLGISFPMSTSGFAEGQRKPRYVPVELSTPIFRLNGM